MPPSREALLSAAHHPLMASLLPPLQLLLSHYDHFPTVEEIDHLLSPLSGIHFVKQSPRPRRPRPMQATSRYEGQIAVQHQVPTRPQNLHDLMNALVWASFPRSKRRLHERQHRAQGKKGESEGHWLRSREQDALAMLDEGGFLWITKEPERAKEALWAGQAGPLLLFGHAIAEHLVEKKPGKGMVVVLEGEGTPDELLAAALERPDWMMEPLPWPALRFSSEFPGSQS